MTGNQAVDSLIGRIFKGYKVTRFIARGGMGLVFEAVQESLDRSVAIKFLYPHLSDDEQFRERFEREARAIARLDHPNIVRVLDFGSDGQLHFMILDYIDGVSLRDQLIRIQADGLTLRTETITSIIQQVGSALAYAHERGYVHRDVKPGNIMLARNGRVFLTDFGVVKDVGALQGTMTGAVIGTPEYMAPEQANGATVGPSADLYALAVETYEMLVGRVPFQSTTPVAVLTKHLHEPPPMPSTIAPWYGPELDAVFLRALAKNPNERYPTAADFSQALIAALHAPRGSQQFPPGYTGSGIQTVVAPPPTQSTHAAMTPPVSGVVHPVTGTPAPGTMGQQGMTPPPGGTGAMSGVPPSGVIPPSGMLPPAGATPLPGDSGRGRVPVIGAILIALLLLLGAGAAYVLLGGDDDDGQRGGTSDESATKTIVAEATAKIADSTTASAEPTKTATNTPAETPTGAAIIDATATAEPTGTGGEPTPSAAVATETEVVTPEVVPIIVFSANRGGVHDSQIFAMALDGSGQRQITFARGHSWGPRVSPDGSRLFFSSVAPGEHQTHDAAGGGTTGTGNHDIYVADLMGTTEADVAVANINNVTAGQLTWDNGWAWSPDGGQITFTTDRNGNWDIYSMSAGGTDELRLTDDPAQDGWPAWTPDGQHILFSSDRTGDWEIFIMNADGSDVRQLTDRPDTTDLFPEVSPDGTRIVFSSQVESVNEGEIYVMTIDGSEVTRLTSTAALNNMPSWCPSGDQIVFTSDRSGNEDIYIMTADGVTQTRLTDDPGEDTTPFCTAISTGAP